MRYVRFILVLGMAMALPGDNGQAQAPPEAPAKEARGAAPGLVAKEREPAFALAAAADEDIRKVEEDYDKSAKQLDEILGQYEKAEKLQPSLEQMTALVWKDYLTVILRNGEDLARVYATLAGAERELSRKLKEAAEYYTAAAKKCADYERESRYEDVKQDYTTLHQLWLAKAQIATDRVAELEAELNAAIRDNPNMLDYLAETNKFLSRMIAQVDAIDYVAVTRLAGGQERLKRHKAYYSQLRAFLKRYSESAAKKAFAPEVRKRAKEREQAEQKVQAEKRAALEQKEAKDRERERIVRLAAYKKDLDDIVNTAITLRPIDQVTGFLVLPEGCPRPLNYEKLSLCRRDGTGEIVYVGRVAVEWHSHGPYALCLDQTLKGGEFALPPGVTLPRPPASPRGLPVRFAANRSF